MMEKGKIVDTGNYEELYERNPTFKKMASHEQAIGLNMFDDKNILITGGTGSFGNAVLNRFLDTNIKEIRIFSRDEKKQDDMRHRLNNPKVKFYIGNVHSY